MSQQKLVIRITSPAFASPTHDTTQLTKYCATALQRAASQMCGAGAFSVTSPELAQAKLASRVEGDTRITDTWVTVEVPES